MSKHFTNEKIEEALCESKLSITDFARKIGLSRQAIYGMLNNAKPAMETLKKIADLVCYNIEYFLSPEKPKPPEKWTEEQRKDYENAQTPEQKRCIYNAASGVNKYNTNCVDSNGVIISNSNIGNGDNNHAIITFYNGGVHQYEISEMEAELIKICKNLNIKEKTRLLSLAYELDEKNLDEDK